jgi:hypothetical protein
LNSGGFVTEGALSLINLISYALAIVVWFGYAVSRKAVRVAATNRLQTERWEQGLTDLQNPLPSDSLIPMFEGMVDRAFSRSSNLEAADQLQFDSRRSASKASSAAAGAKTRP